MPDITQMLYELSDPVSEECEHPHVDPDGVCLICEVQLETWTYLGE